MGIEEMSWIGPVWTLCLFYRLADSNDWILNRGSASIFNGQRNGGTGSDRTIDSRCRKKEEKRKKDEKGNSSALYVRGGAEPPKPNK